MQPVWNQCGKTLQPASNRDRGFVKVVFKKNALCLPKIFNNPGTCSFLSPLHTVSLIDLDLVGRCGLGEISDRQLSVSATEVRRGKDDVEQNLRRRDAESAVRCSISFIYIYLLASLISSLVFGTTVCRTWIYNAASLSPRSEMFALEQTEKHTNTADDHVACTLSELPVPAGAKI